MLEPKDGGLSIWQRGKGRATFAGDENQGFALFFLPRNGGLA